MRPSPRRPHALALLLLSLPLLGAGCGNEERAEWRVTWEDEFDGPAGQLPDASRWGFDVGTDWGNAQLEYDTDRATNVSLDGQGNLAITARREDFQNREYTSGRINTAGLFDQARGRFETRIKLPVGQGIWPAFWLLGANFATAGWPDCGEIDILEYRGQEPNILISSLHGPGYSGGSAVGGTFTLPGNDGFDAGFHTFAIEWNEDYIIWLLDNTPYQTITRNGIPSGAPWVFDHPFFIILNVAVGGHFVGPPDGSTVFPQTMLVDWVRVWTLD